MGSVRHIGFKNFVDKNKTKKEIFFAKRCAICREKVRELEVAIIHEK